MITYKTPDVTYEITDIKIDNVFCSNNSLYFKIKNWKGIGKDEWSIPQAFRDYFSSILKRLYPDWISIDVSCFNAQVTTISKIDSAPLEDFLNEIA
jgi:hypothetical protein